MRKIIAAAIIAAVSTAAYAPAKAEVPNDAQTLALAGRIDNNSFDRAALMLGNQVQFWQPVFDTLIIEAPDGKFLPNLATAWSYDDTQTVLTIKLLDGVKFTDGTAFDAAAVKANLEYLAAGTGQNGYMARSIENYEIVSSTEIKLRLKVPDPALVANLSTVGGAIASPATLGKPGSDVNPVGSGPYVYDAKTSVPGSQYVYRRNESYWNKNAFPFNQVTIAPINDDVARINAVLSGQADATIANTRSMAQAKSAGLKVHKADVNWIGLILADRAGKITPALADVRVRQALNMAFDTKSIMKYIELENGKLTDQIFPDTSLAYEPALDDHYKYDPKRAKQLLAEAGYEKGFTLVLPNILPFAAFYPVVQQQLADIGITVKLENLPPGSALPLLRSAKFSAYVFTFGSGDAWTDIQQHIAPEAAWNAFHSSDPVLTELIKTAQYAAGDNQKKAFQAVNRYVVENAWFVPWYRQFSVYLTAANVDVDMQLHSVAPSIRDYRPAK